MARPATAVIKLSAIKQNYLYAKSLAAPAKAIATIKANAYGHGAIEVANELSDVADAFAVACIEEAKELRDAGIEQPILLLEGFFTADELTYISEFNLWTVIHSQYQLDAIQQASFAKPINAWLKMDTGMHRLGFLPHQYANAWQQLEKMPQVNSITHITHFSSADDLSSLRTKQQTELFLETVGDLPGDISIANSSAVLTKAMPDRVQWVRPGIMLYGASPIDSPEIAKSLAPAMTFKAKVISERIIEAGECVGYNALWEAKEPSKIGTVSIGYADGYPRHAGTGTPVLVNGKKSQLLGRVAMDMIMIDLSMFEDQDCIGYEVEFWGDNIPVNEIAQCADTIGYTLLCGISRRVNKQYVK
ncbi:alanine racemase [Psychromonas sp. 14N.309.X.WAT.B.A12]|jgi:alanine racemase|uniref:alanine racemase n=3 Tax=Psychromonas TaxID=67572 RepID=UPI0025B257FB|nr:alanine racemase [Psychromonas sp. 14N.309.X.WAT.B.A12]MDN2662464.1 alanine racemase [Psychromonas sp. 14N.309.X.WAT.B.A12]